MDFEIPAGYPMMEETSIFNCSIFSNATNEQKKESDMMCPVSTESTSMSDSKDFNRYGRPFVVGCGALTTREYVVTPDLGNFIDKWQAPARESEQHSAKKSFRIRHTLNREK